MKLETDIIHCQKLNLFDGNRGLNCFARRQFNVEPIVDIRQTQPLPNYSTVPYIIIFINKKIIQKTDQNLCVGGCVITSQATWRDR